MSRETSNALPMNFYRDPMEVAMRSEAKRCDGCKHLEKAFGREFCGIGRRTLAKCRKFELKKE